MFGKNWKTSLGGLGSILTAIADIVHGFTTDPNMIKWQVDIAAITVGISLLFAKDGNVTGGTVMQPTPKDVLVEKKEELHDAGVKP